MTLFDVILLIFLFGFTLFGFWFGLIHTFGAVIGAIIGAFIAGHTFEPAAQKLLFLFADNLNLARVVCFIVIFVLVNRLTGLVFVVIEKVFKIISFIPFLKTINRLAGAVFGFIEGFLVIGLVLYVAGRYPIGLFWDKVLSGSQVAPYFVEVGETLSPLLPDILNQLESIISII